MNSVEAKKLDILLNLKNEGFNLTDGVKPEIMNMSLGGGYTLECNIKNPTDKWIIRFDDGVEQSEYPANSEKVVYTHRKDSDKLINEYNTSLKSIGITENQTEANAKHEKTIPPKKKNTTVKKKKRVEAQNSPGMVLPIVYPSEMKGNFIRFRQWTANNDVIPQNSEVVILEESEYTIRVSIPQAHISFDMPRDKVEVVQA